jgi:preprotein translocase subunit SecE
MKTIVTSLIIANLAVFIGICYFADQICNH